ncbi:MAG: hypothetical protein LBO72_08865 [Helicobacteraceae bacterium]|nr:hypothetical protein [Helicobacteraceae bacterium]
MRWAQWFGFVASRRMMWEWILRLRGNDGGRALQRGNDKKWRGFCDFLRALRRYRGGRYVAGMTGGGD